MSSTTSIRNVQIPMQLCNDRPFSPTRGEGGFPTKINHPKGLAVVLASRAAMANLLENTMYDINTMACKVPQGKHLSVIHVTDTQGEQFSSSWKESGRFGTLAFKNAVVAATKTSFSQVLDGIKGLRPDQQAQRILALDINSVLHGALAPSIGARLDKIVDLELWAYGVTEVPVAGARRSGLDTPCPHNKMLYYGGEVILNMDLKWGVLKQYGLTPEQVQVLHALAAWQIRTLLSEEVYIRTDCAVRLVPGYDLPIMTLAEAEAVLNNLLPKMGWSPTTIRLKDTASEASDSTPTEEDETD